MKEDSKVVNEPLKTQPLKTQPLKNFPLFSISRSKHHMTISTNYKRALRALQRTFQFIYLLFIKLLSANYKSIAIPEAPKTDTDTLETIYEEYKSNLTDDDESVASTAPSSPSLTKISILKIDSAKLWPDSGNETFSINSWQGSFMFENPIWATSNGYKALHKRTASLPDIKTRVVVDADGFQTIKSKRSKHSKQRSLLNLKSDRV